MKKHKMESRNNWDALKELQVRAPNQKHLVYEGGDFTMRCEEYFQFPIFNFRQLVIRHSETGMSWGYGGSGPSDCALNVLLNYISKGTGLVTDEEEDFINNHYMEFKQEHVAPLKMYDEEITSVVIEKSKVAKFVSDRGLVVT